MSEIKTFPYGSIVEAFADHAKKTPDKVFSVDGKKQYTYEDGMKIACGYAAYLKEQGVKAGDCVITKVSQTAAPFFCDLAVQLLHAVYVPVEKVVAAERVNFIIEKTGATIFVSDKDLGVNARFLPLKEIYDHAAESVPEDIDFPVPEETGEILFTTGTTGTSKGVEMSNVATVHVAENVVNAIGLTPDDTEIIPIPINHAMGIRRAYANMLVGSKIVILDGVVFIDRIWKAFEEHGATGMCLVPAMLQVIFKLSGDKIGEYADRLAYMQIGASVLTHDDKQRLCELLPNTRLYDFYGCSEAGCACTADFNKHRDKFKSLGIPT
ncbi:MAG: AMP-binding protein, partial [Lachnospiraceae bacterium]|nr:AMP-binding protein [Lachnospiraceae bacterium]